MSGLALSDLISTLTSTQARATLLSLAQSLGLETTAWKALDPTRTLFYMVADLGASFSSTAVDIAASGFLAYAEGGWLTLHALNTYGVIRTPATFATGEVTLTNASASVYVIAVGDVIVQNSTSEKTYRNSSGGNLNPGSTLTLDFIATEAGSGSTSSATDIDTMVTNYLGVTCSNAAALIGADEESDAELRLACERARGALSPNGPQEAYEYIATHTLRADGITRVDITRVLVTSSSGAVTVTLAAENGAPIGADVTLCNTAIQNLVVPLGVTCTVQAATNNTIAVTYTAYIPSDWEGEDSDLEDAIETALEEHFKLLPIAGQKKSGGGSKYAWTDDIKAIINHVNMGSEDAPDRPVFTTDLTLPAADVAIAATEVPKLGAVTATITRITQ